MCGIFAFRGSSVSLDQLKSSSKMLERRGPDHASFDTIAREAYMAFYRLAIMDTSFHGNQPFKNKESDFLICNGEVYNYETLKSEFLKDYSFESHSDCEVILPLIKKFGIEKTVKKLDAEFALIYWDAKKNAFLAARDPIGIRPLFVGYTQVKGEIAFASEAKALHAFCKDIKPFPPGHYFDGEKFISYRSMVSQPTKSSTRTEATTKIATLLTDAIVKRLHSDRTLGCLLSGGLDSSLVAAIAAKNLSTPLRTFAIGTKVDPIDLKYASIVAKHIHSDHTEVYFEHEEPIEVLDEVIKTIESWDTTTVRASIGMYLVCKAIRKNSPVKVLLTGEVSDELFGYKYTDFAPSPDEFQREAIKRVDELHYFDVLRADRCISAHGLEARVPFGDLEFVDHVMSITPKDKMNLNKVGKSLLREAFSETQLLPHEILYREKAAFSDAVGHSMVDNLKAYAEKIVSDQEFEEAANMNPPPLTKEALLYRKIFEKHYPGRSALIKSYWMPNMTWQGCNVTDPSARVLSNYGASGH